MDAAAIWGVSTPSPKKVGQRGLRAAARRSLSLALSALLLGGIAASARADVGVRDFSYTGASAPTADKPQSKTWHNDGAWWADLYRSSTGRYEIFRLEGNGTWVPTGTAIDSRSRSQADMLWDGTKLYAASVLRDGATSGDQTAKVTRWSYNPATRTYSVDAGFPVTVFSYKVESITIDKDTTGALWLTWTRTASGSRKVYVSHSSGASQSTFVTPFVLPVPKAIGLTTDDISTLAAYDGKIGVLWGHQADQAYYFASHVDGAPDTAWTPSTAAQDAEIADDHINLKALSGDPSGRLFAAVKAIGKDRRSDAE